MVKPTRSRAKGSGLERHVALLRGINVGGKNKLPMAELVALFEAIGCERVSTFIQSGNVIFSADPGLRPLLPAKLSHAIKQAHGFDVPVVLRSARELDRVVEGNPFLARGEAVERLHVVFLADAPTPEGVRALDPSRSPPDQLMVQGSEIYLLCPNGLGKSRLTNAYFDSKLKTVSTVRNWNTVLKLAALARAE